VLLQDRDDLFFRKAIALHALVLSAGQNELQAGLGQRGKVSEGAGGKRLFVSSGA